MSDTIFGLLCLLIPVGIVVLAVRAVKKQKKAKKAILQEKEEEEEEKRTIQQSHLSNGMRFRFPTESAVDITTDEFDATKTLKFAASAGFGMDKYFLHSETHEQFRIGFRTIGDKNTIIFGCLQKEIKFQKGDRVSLLFADSTLEEFVLEEKGYKVENDLDGVVLESFSFLTDAQIKKFSETFIVKWRLYYSEKVPLTGDLSLSNQESFRSMAVAYLYALENFYNKDNYIKKED